MSTGVTSTCVATGADPYTLTPQYSLWGGWKLSCSTAREEKEPVCPTLTGLSNVCYPRTDPVIIMVGLPPLRV